MTNTPENKNENKHLTITLRIISALIIAALIGTALLLAAVITTTLMQRGNPDHYTTHNTAQTTLNNGGKLVDMRTPNNRTTPLPADAYANPKNIESSIPATITDINQPIIYYTDNTKLANKIENQLKHLGYKNIQPITQETATTLKNN